VLLCRYAALLARLSRQRRRGSPLSPTPDLTLPRARSTRAGLRQDFYKSAALHRPFPVRFPDEDHLKERSFSNSPADPDAPFHPPLSFPVREIALHLLDRHGSAFRPLYIRPIDGRVAGLYQPRSQGVHEPKQRPLASARLRKSLALVWDQGLIATPPLRSFKTHQPVLVALRAI
jgi:hypothetical protein